MPTVKPKRTGSRPCEATDQGIRDCLTQLERLRSFARLLVTRTPAATRVVIEDSDIKEAKSATEQLANVLPAAGEAVARFDCDLILEPVTEPTHKNISDFSYLGRGGLGLARRESDHVPPSITAESGFHLVLKIAHHYLGVFEAVAGLDLTTWREQWNEKRLGIKLRELPEFDSDWLLAKCKSERRRGHQTVWEESTSADHREREPVQYVTLDQAAALVSRSKRTLERYKTKGDLPAPDIEGGGGKPDEWEWPRIRVWLEKTFPRTLPERLPQSHLRRS